MTTELGQICSDIGKAGIIDINVCKEAQKWLQNGTQWLHFIDESTPNPPPNITMGCLGICNDYNDYEQYNDCRIVTWTWVESIAPHHAHTIMEICLNSGEYILVYYFSLITYELYF